MVWPVKKPLFSVMNVSVADQSLSLTPVNWRWSSVPSRALVVADGNALATQKFFNLERQRNAEVHWFNPINTRGNTTDNELVHERDLRLAHQHGLHVANLKLMMSPS